MTGTYANSINTDRMKRLLLLQASWRLQPGGRNARTTKDLPSVIKMPCKVTHFYSINLKAEIFFVREWLSCFLLLEFLMLN